MSAIAAPHSPTTEQVPATALARDQDRNVTNVAPTALSALLAKGDAVVIDVREPDEYAIERIEGALLMPLSMFDAEKFPRVFDKKVVLACAIGKRSRAAGLQMLKAGFAEVFHLDGGLKAWKEAGLELEA